jgi:type I restriction enzyme R subunit
MNESVVEQALLEWLADLRYEVRHGSEIAPGEPGEERDDYREVLLVGRLRNAITQINPGAPAAAIDEAIRVLKRSSSPSLVTNNRDVHRLIVDGVTVQVQDPRSGTRGHVVKLLDFQNPDANDWIAVNQFTVLDRSERRPDVLLFVNGIPLVDIELKNPRDEDADWLQAFNQHQTYKAQIPSLERYNAVMMASDGLSDARVGSLTAPKEWFMPWRTIDGEDLAPPTANKLEVLVRGVFERSRFLDLLRHFVVFEEEDGGLAKKIAGYHQFHATRRAVETAVAAASEDGDRRGGVVWHTQGSGKSLTMAFFAGKLVAQPELANPTIVVLTDRIDLDGQLFGVFSRCRDLLRQTPEQADSRAELRSLLDRVSGGVVFTTVQKFLPEERGDRFPTLSDRRNIVVIADEAHRTQYDFIDGFARHMRDALPNATFVGFTGTPLELDDRDTRAVFGDYIDRYDIRRAVEDGATVPIYYESRLAKLDLLDAERPKLDEAFEEITEDEEVQRRERLKTKWAQLEAVVGTEKRLALIAEDLVRHFEERLQAMDGKAMVVCMSRRICVDLYAEIVKLRPEWHADDDAAGAVKVVMTGSNTDPVSWQPHIRNKRRREDLATRFKDAADPFKIVIVRDMWLTGFDAPSLHTMYVDKPMRGHGLMQAIARVNRVFRDKPGGLVVDYLGIADDLRKALAVYAESGGTGEAAIDQGEAVALMLEEVEVCRGLFHGFDYGRFLRGTASERLHVLPEAQEHILAQDEGRDRLVRSVLRLSKAFALAVPRQEALDVRDEVAFFQTVKAALVKTERGARTPQEDLDHAVKQIVAGAIAPEGVIDVFEAAGLQKPDISLLSEEFLAEVRDLPQRNLAVELLQKLLNDEIVLKRRRSVVQSRRFSEMLEAALHKYQARAITTAQVIEELIELAREMRAAQDRGEALGLSDEEMAFYDALETNDSAVAVLGDEVLLTIARELTQTVRRNATIDWTQKQSVQAAMRVAVKRILRRHGYPPDLQQRAVDTVLEQAEQLGWEFTEAGAAAPGVAEVVPFRRLEPAEVRPYENCIPLMTLEVAAGGFSGSQEVEVDAWVAVDAVEPGEGLFVAQVRGESMNRRIPNGAYCVFRSPVEGSRNGRVLLVQHRDIEDPEHGGSYTVKVYERQGEMLSETGERLASIILKPNSDDSRFDAILLTPQSESEVRVIAEVARVL